MRKTLWALTAAIWFVIAGLDLSVLIEHVQAHHSDGVVYRAAMLVVDLLVAAMAGLMFAAAVGEDRG